MRKNIIFFLLPFLFFISNFKILDNTNYNNKSFFALNQNDKIIDISLGSYHSGVTIDTNNDQYADTLYMWGNNNSGQVGDGERYNDVLIPTKITPQGQSNWNGNIIDISLGYSHSGVTIDTDYDGYADTLYMWGSNMNGEIGNGTTIYSLFPTKITPQGQSNWNGNIIDISLGINYSGVTIDTDLDGNADTLYMWGDNFWGSMGIGRSSSDVLYPMIITPQSQDDWGGNIISLSLGNLDSGVTIDTDYDGYADTLYMWGANDAGQINGSESNIWYPTIIAPQGQSNWNGNIIDISLGGWNSGITVDTDLDGNADTLYMWGDNSYGQLGNGETGGSVSTPTKITPQGQSNWNGNIINFSLGDDYSSIIIDTNLDEYADTLYMWGDNSYGQLGNGTIIDLSYPTIITLQGQSNWNGNIINISLGEDHSGIIIDTDYDGYADTLYMWGRNNYGQLGDGTTNDILNPEVILSKFDFLISNLQYYYEGGNNIEFNLLINDYQNIINEAPEVMLIDQNDLQYTTIYIEDKSNTENDQYYYQINDILYGDNYQFEEIIINNNAFYLQEENIITDYLISSYQVVDQQQEEVTINLDLSQNDSNFNINNYTNNQRKIKVNYQNLDTNIINSQEFVINDSYQIRLNNLNAETNYQIYSIEYFYENGNYKYTINQEITQFQTTPAIPIIEVDSISLVENSITTTSFEYTIEIDNLKENQTVDNFTQYDINNGLWLIDNQGQTYNSSFINAKVISNGQINGTQNYQITFLQENLRQGQIYNFTGIGFNDPNGSNPDTINFQEPFIVETVSINKQFVNDSFIINQDSITKSSFEYKVTIDNLIYFSDSPENEPIFTNFNEKNGLYLLDDQGNVYDSDYILNSAVLISEGTEEGTVKYQFTFIVNDLEANTTYNFVSLSFTDNFDNKSLDISQNGQIITDNNSSNISIIYLIIIILIVILLMGLILFFVYLKMRKRTMSMLKELDNPDNYKN